MSFFTPLFRTTPRLQTPTLLRQISYKPNPNTPRTPPATLANKIPPAARPLFRAPVPPPTITQTELQSRLYAVRRTPFAQLPVYRNWKSGGTRQIILIKKVSGDKNALVQELLEKVVGGDKERIRINPTTGHVELTVSGKEKNMKELGREYADWDL